MRALLKRRPTQKADVCMLEMPVNEMPRSDAILKGNVDHKSCRPDPGCMTMPPSCLGRNQRFRSLLSKGSLPLRVLLDDQRTHCIGTQPLPPRRGQLGRKLQPTGPLDSLERHLKVCDGLGVWDRCVGQDKCTQCHVSTNLAILSENDLVKVRRHRDGGRVSNHLVLGIPFAVRGVALGEVERAGDDAHAGVALGKPAAKVLKVRPVIPVETLADLGAHVAQKKGLVHGRLAPFAVGGGDLMPTVVAATEVVLQVGTELVGDGGILDKDGVLAVAVALGERAWCDVLDDPVRVAQAAVVGGDEGGAGCKVGDGAWEAILEEAGGIDKANGEW